MKKKDFKTIRNSVIAGLIVAVLSYLAGNYISPVKQEKQYCQSFTVVSPGRAPAHIKYCESLITSNPK